MTTTDYGGDREARLVRESVQRHWSGRYGPARNVDPLLLVAVVGLVTLGLVVVYSATQHRLELIGADPMHFVNRQLVALGLGVVAMLVVAAIDYRIYRVWAPVIYAVSIVMLIITAATGTTVNASRAWIVFGGFQFQPAELAKPALILMLAALFHERREEALGMRALVEAVTLAAVPIGLILLQPDLGTAIVFVAITFGVLLLARVRVRYMIALAAIGIVSMAGAYQLDILQAYQVERLTTFLNAAEADPQSAGYNVNQAIIAVGSGQISGQGLFQGTQTSLGYVPESHTDFIFTVIGEELGFLGAALLLGLYALLLWRALRIAATARDTLGMLICAGIIAVFSFQLFINVGMAVGIMPVTGLPLPFVSYGGTSLIGSLLMIGLLQNVYMRRHT
jgi:rod shape determining protein RodA